MINLQALRDGAVGSLVVDAMCLLLAVRLPYAVSLGVGKPLPYPTRCAIAAMFYDVFRFKVEVMVLGDKPERLAFNAALRRVSPGRKVRLLPTAAMTKTIRDVVRIRVTQGLSPWVKLRDVTSVAGAFTFFIFSHTCGQFSSARGF